MPLYISTSSPDIVTAVVTAAKIIAASLDRLTSQLQSMEGKMDEAMQKLVDQVAATTSVEASAVLAIQSIADQLKAVSTDPAKILELANKLEASTGPLAAAIAANTPAAPNP